MFRLFQLPHKVEETLQEVVLRLRSPMMVVVETMVGDQKEHTGSIHMLLIITILVSFILTDRGIQWLVLD